MFKYILFLMLPAFLFAQLSVLPISADYAIFNHSDSTSYVEIYLSFYQGNLSFFSKNDSTISTFETQLVLKKGDEEYKTLTHKYSSVLTDTSSLAGYRQFADIFGIILPIGKYSAVVRLTDTHKGTKGEYLLDINTEDADYSDQFNLSDIQLASKIERANQKSMFYKNGYLVYPNPRSTFDILQPMLYYYIELNDLSFDSDNSNTYTFSYMVTNSRGDTVKENAPSKKKIIGKTQLEIGGFNVMSLPSDVYLLKISAKDNKSGITVDEKKKFFVYKPKRQQKNQKGITQNLPKIDSQFLNMTKDELAEEFNEAKYIATRDESDVFSKLDSTNAMQAFLTQFWRRRDQASGIQYGQSRQKYLQLAEEANQQFRSGFRRGWKSDRGRVLLIYGHPSEIDRYPNSVDKLPYVIWKYNDLEGGVEFVFCDRNGFGEYELIHSTYSKELYNPNWYQIISKNTSSSSGTGY